mmetsp:Transcript_39663/g.113601  ORF Transcript_39663/g.113601 Transcript_39663/m.113601 type:complete len:200 (+) Transcript_39663:297-896(+)
MHTAGGIRATLSHCPALPQGGSLHLEIDAAYLLRAAHARCGRPARMPLVYQGYEPLGLVVSECLDLCQFNSVLQLLRANVHIGVATHARRSRCRAVLKVLRSSQLDSARHRRDHAHVTVRLLGELPLGAGGGGARGEALRSRVESDALAPGSWLLRPEHRGGVRAPLRGPGGAARRRGVRAHGHLLWGGGEESVCRGAG